MIVSFEEESEVGRVGEPTQARYGKPEHRGASEKVVFPRIAPHRIASHRMASQGQVHRPVAMLIILATASCSYCTSAASLLLGRMTMLYLKTYGERNTFSNASR